MCSPTRLNANKPTNYQQRTNPRSCARVVFIAGDTLRQQPIGAGHMTVLQLRGPMGSRALPWWLFIAGDTLCHQPMRTGHMTVLQLCRLMEFHVLQWCHPMLASTTRTSCCTRMITLYGARKWIQARALSLAVVCFIYQRNVFSFLCFGIIFKCFEDRRAYIRLLKNVIDLLS